MSGIKRFIVGIDPGISCTGYAVLSIENGKMTLVCSGVIKVPSQLCGYSDKLFYVCSTLKNIFDRYDVLKFVISFEVPFFGKNAKSFSVLSMVRGAILVFFNPYILDVFEFSPSQIKSYIGFSGSASKESVKDAVIRYFPGLIINQLDESDALAISLCGMLCEFRQHPSPH